MSDRALVHCGDDCIIDFHAIRAVRPAGRVDFATEILTSDGESFLTNLTIPAVRELLRAAERALAK